MSVKFDQAIAPSYEHLRPYQPERSDTFPVYPEPGEMLVKANKPVTSGRSSRKHTMASEITGRASATTADLRPGRRGVISVRRAAEVVCQRRATASRLDQPELRRTVGEPRGHPPRRLPRRACYHLLTSRARIVHVSGRGIALTSKHTTRMQRLSPQDAPLLHLEDAVSHMHIARWRSSRDRPPPYDALAERVRANLPQVPRYRQKVHFVPLALSRPVWVDDPHFNLGYHLRRTALPEPGGDEQLRL